MPSALLFIGLVGWFGLGLFVIVSPLAYVFCCFVRNYWKTPKFRRVVKTLVARDGGGYRTMPVAQIITDEPMTWQERCNHAWTKTQKEDPLSTWV